MVEVSGEVTNIRDKQKVGRYTRKRLGSGPEWAVFLDGKFIGVIGANIDGNSNKYDVLDWKDGSFGHEETIKACMEWLERV
jgi:hypothetical protein